MLLVKMGPGPTLLRNVQFYILFWYVGVRGRDLMRRRFHQHGVPAPFRVTQMYISSYEYDHFGVGAGKALRAALVILLKRIRSRPLPQCAKT